MKPANSASPFGRSIPGHTASSTELQPSAGERGKFPFELGVLEAAVVRRFRVSDLAQHFGISTRQLRRKFARHIGCTPERWLRVMRLQAASRLLSTARSVKQVAHELEFRHAAQFCRDFRAHFGCSPSQYMQRRAFGRLEPVSKNVA